MIDIKLVSTPDGGDIDTSGGGIALDRTAETAIELSLEGGNYDDTGDPSSDSKQWWGNYATKDTAEHLRSRTQAVLRGMPATVANLQELTNAVLLDLAWTTGGVIFDKIAAKAKLVGRNRALIELDTTQNGQTARYAIRAPWQP